MSGEKRGKKSKWITCTVEGRKRIGKNRLKRLSHTVLCTCTKKSLTILSENANGQKILNQISLFIRCFNSLLFK